LRRDSAAPDAISQPTIETEIQVKKIFAAFLLIAGLAACAPLTEQQKEAIDYQNHKPWAI